VDSETGQAILDSIKGILAAVGQNDYEEFRKHVGEGAILLRNLAEAAETVAKLSDQDLSTLIAGLQDPERTLRLMNDLKDYLPKFGTKIVEGAQMVFPQPTGGAPPIFKNRGDERDLCKLIMKFIAQGDTEAKAKRRAKTTLAKRDIEASMTTINRIWKRRAEILNEPSFEEFFGQLLRSWSVKAPQEATPVTEGGDKLIDGSK
jgi:hypothetical protein